VRTEAVPICPLWHTRRAARHTSMQAKKLTFGQKTVRRSVDRIGTKLAL
jgi:hypothetical protein